jgi:hypothetical protein
MKKTTSYQKREHRKLAMSGAQLFHKFNCRLDRLSFTYVNRDMYSTYRIGDD